MDNTFRGTQKAFMNAVIHKGFLVPLYTFYKNTTPSIRYISPQNPSHTLAFRNKIPESYARRSPRLI